MLFGGEDVPFWGVEMCQFWGVEMCWDEVIHNRKINGPERIPPSGKIRQGPVLRALDKPKFAVKSDVAKVTAKRPLSEPISARIGDSLSRFSDSRKVAKIAMNVKMAVAGMAS